MIRGVFLTCFIKVPCKLYCNYFHCTSFSNRKYFIMSVANDTSIRTYIHCINCIFKILAENFSAVEPTNHVTCQYLEADTMQSHVFDDFSEKICLNYEIL